jgi:hypothetical protein
MCRDKTCLSRFWMLSVCAGSLDMAVANLKAGSKGCVACAHAWLEGECMCPECDPEVQIASTLSELPLPVRRQVAATIIQRTIRSRA